MYSNYYLLSECINLRHQYIIKNKSDNIWVGSRNVLPMNANIDVKLYISIQDSDNIKPFYKFLTNLWWICYLYHIYTYMYNSHWKTLHS